MPKLELPPGERCVAQCDTAYFDGSFFPARGRLYLTNRRVIYRKIGLAAWFGLGALLAQGLVGTKALEMPLEDIAGVAQERHRANPRCLKFTLRNGKTHIFAVNGRWREELRRQMHR